MRYSIKGFLIDNSTLDCRFECIVSSFDEVVEFLSRVSMEAYEYVKVYPIDFEMEK